jgi:hypothetical protein
VHWNHHIQQYVILMNRAIDPRWKQDGIYISFTPDLSDPNSWTEPLRILEEKAGIRRWLGSIERQETEREAGEPRACSSTESRTTSSVFLK